MKPDLKAESEKEKMIETRLSLAEKDKLFAFCQDKDMVGAVEKVMLYALHISGTVSEKDPDMLDNNWAYTLGFNASISDQNLGAELRGKIAGLTFLDDAFRQVKKFGDKPTTLVEAPNPAL